MNSSRPLQTEGVIHSGQTEPALLRMPLLIVGESNPAHLIVHRLLSGAQCEVRSCFSFEDAAGAVETQDAAVVMCDRDLPGAGWIKLLEACQRKAHPSRFILFAKAAEVSLWAEVLNLGGYDMLMYPFEMEEVVRVTRLAFGSWLREGARGSRNLFTLAEATGTDAVPKPAVKAASMALSLAAG